MKALIKPQPTRPDRRKNWKDWRFWKYSWGPGVFWMMVAGGGSWSHPHLSAETVGDLGLETLIWIGCVTANGCKTKINKWKNKYADWVFVVSKSRCHCLGAFMGRNASLSGWFSWDVFSCWLTCYLGWPPWCVPLNLHPQRHQQYV